MSDIFGGSLLLAHNDSCVALACSCKRAEANVQIDLLTLDMSTVPGGDGRGKSGSESLHLNQFDKYMQQC